MATTRSAAPIGRAGRAFFILAFSLASVATAKAQGTPEQRAACTPDALRLCSAEIPDVARVTACMRANQSRLSERCRVAFLGAGAPHAQERPHARYAYAGKNTRHFRHRSHHGMIMADGGHHRYRHHGYGQGMAMAMQVIAGLSQSGLMNGFMNGGDGGWNNSGWNNGGGWFDNGGGGWNDGGGYMNSGMAQSFMSSGMGQEFMNSGMANMLMQYMR